MLGITTDEIGSLSITELRARLREAKQTESAKDKIIAKRDAKITALEEAAERPWSPGEQSVAESAEEAAALEALNEATNGIDVYFTQLGQSVATLTGHPREAVRTRALQAATYLVSRMRDVIAENALDIDTSDEGFGLRPAYLDFKA